jgi:hypothetical protein
VYGVVAKIVLLHDMVQGSRAFRSSFQHYQGDYKGSTVYLHRCQNVGSNIHSELQVLIRDTSRDVEYLDLLFLPVF